MATANELERCAAMGNALRPDWPVRSLLTYLEQNQAHRPYRDLATALAYIATDPLTKTPRRLSEAGPWWTTSRAANDAPDAMPGTHRCPKPDHGHERASNCRICTAERIAAPATDAPWQSDRTPLVSPERVAAILAGVRTRTIPTQREGIEL